MNPDVDYLVCLLQSCNTHHFIHQGKQLHLIFLKKGLLESTVTIGNRLLQMYVRCGSVSDAHALFEEMPHRNCFSWNTMIEGYMKLGDCVKSLELFKSMPERSCNSTCLLYNGSMVGEFAFHAWLRVLLG